MQTKYKIDTTGQTPQRQKRRRIAAFSPKSRAHRHRKNAKAERENKNKKDRQRKWKIPTRKENTGGRYGTPTLIQEPGALARDIEALAEYKRTSAACGTKNHAHECRKQKATAPPDANPNDQGQDKLTAHQPDRLGQELGRLMQEMGEMDANDIATEKTAATKAKTDDGKQGK